MTELKLHTHVLNDYIYQTHGKARVNHERQRWVLGNVCVNVKMFFYLSDIICTTNGIKLLK